MRIAFLSAFGAVDHEQDPLLGVEAALDQVGEQRRRDGRVLGRAFPEPERDLDALGRDPEADDVGASLQLEPVDHHRRQPDVVEAATHQLAERATRPLNEHPRDGRLRRRPRPLLDLSADRLLRAPVAAGGDAGQHPLQHRTRQRVTVGEVVVGAQPHLRAAVGAAHARPLHRDAAAAERHLARLVTVTHRDPINVVLAARPDDLDDFLFDQLGQHAQPDTDAERQQPLLRSADQLPEHLLHAFGQHDFVHARLRERYVPVHGGSSFDLRRIASNAPNKSGRGRRDRRQVLRATGQPPRTRAFFYPTHGALVQNIRTPDRAIRIDVT